MTTPRGKFEQFLDRLEEDGASLTTAEITTAFQGLKEFLLLHPQEGPPPDMSKILEAVLTIENYSIEKLQMIMGQIKLLVEEEYSFTSPTEQIKSVLIDLKNLQTATTNRIKSLPEAQEKKAVLAKGRESQEINQQLNDYILALKEFNKEIFGSVIQNWFRTEEGPIDVRLKATIEILDTMAHTQLLDDNHNALFEQVKAQFYQEFANFLPSKPKPPQVKNPIHSLAKVFLQEQRLAKTTKDLNLVREIQRSVYDYIAHLKKQLPKNTDHPKYHELQEKIQLFESFQKESIVDKPKADTIYAYKELIETLGLPPPTKRFGVFSNNTASPELNLLLQAKEIFADEYKGPSVSLNDREQEAVENKKNDLLIEISDKLLKVSGHPQKKAVLQACKNFLVEGSGKDQLLKCISENPRYADGHFSKETEKLVRQTLQIKQSDLEQIYRPGPNGPSTGPKK